MKRPIGTVWLSPPPKFCDRSRPNTGLATATLLFCEMCCVSHHESGAPQGSPLAQFRAVARPGHMAPPVALQDLCAARGRDAVTGGSSRSGARRSRSRQYAEVGPSPTSSPATLLAWTKAHRQHVAHGQGARSSQRRQIPGRSAGEGGPVKVPHAGAPGTQPESRRGQNAFAASPARGRLRRLRSHWWLFEIFQLLRFSIPVFLRLACAFIGTGAGVGFGTCLGFPQGLQC